MRLYNTLTRQIDEVVPQNAPDITVYTCGPTVYDYLHVGNWFTYIREDILIRTLKASGLKPKWVMNITDVGHLVSDADDGEDKLEKGARREGKTAWDVAKFYTEYFEKGMERLNMLKPDFLPRATDHIQDQIELVQKLEAKGFTYKTSDGVYYDTSKFPKYADFARLDLDEQEAGKRVNFNPEKRNKADFALWKFSPKDHQRDMEWDSPWGKGFPGWHVECSAMSMKYLGETLDIHAGGIDHVPVHHTNEIAQSEAATGKQFATYWMHSNHITIEGKKISKSFGNGITLEDIEAKGYSLEVLRLHVLESHYRSQSKFSWESLAAAKNRLNVLHAWADLRHQTSVDVMPDELDLLFKELRGSVLSALQDDLNTPVALVSFNKIINYMSNIQIPGVEGKYTDGTLAFLDDLLGLQLSARPDITYQQKEIITEREQARTAQDWAKSDKLREQLEKQGIGLRDIPNGAIWFRL
ncbi:MAG: cysteine--tRNA ligase [Candidatus Saccharimonadales bacterium]